MFEERKSLRAADGDLAIRDMHGESSSKNEIASCSSSFRLSFACFIQRHWPREWSLFIRKLIVSSAATVIAVLVVRIVVGQETRICFCLNQSYHYSTNTTSVLRSKGEHPGAHGQATLNYRSFRFPIIEQFRPKNKITTTARIGNVCFRSFLPQGGGDEWSRSTAVAAATADEWLGSNP